MKKTDSFVEHLSGLLFFFINSVHLHLHKSSSPHHLPLLFFLAVGKEFSLLRIISQSRMSISEGISKNIKIVVLGVAERSNIIIKMSC